MSENRYKDGSVEAHAYWHGRGVQAHEQSKEIDTLRAELERVTRERDQYIERCDDLQTVQLRMVEELAKVEGEARVAREERDAARAAAATLRKWGATWRVIAWDSERFQQFRTFDNIQQMWATVRPDVECEDLHDPGARDE